MKPPSPFLYFKTYFFYGYLQPSGSWEVIHENFFMVACHFCMYLPLPLLVVMFSFGGTYDDRYGGSDSRNVMVMMLGVWWW